MATIDLRNSTPLSTDRLSALVQDGVRGWTVGRLSVWFRHSRGADFSGACYYAGPRIFVNLGRHLTFPYRLRTNLARAKTVGRRWYRPILTMDLRDAYELSAFIFMHELYHLLVKRARRNTRQKEAMCDRFAARFVVARFGRAVQGPKGGLVPRTEWDFQDLERFVSAARDHSVQRSMPPLSAAAPPPSGEQLLLFAG